MIKKVPKCSLRAVAALAASGVLLPGAWAQTSSPPLTKTQIKPETVVVTGHKPRQDADTMVSQFVDLHTAPNRKTGQYMRDDIGAVCPITLGLPDAFNRFVTARVVQVAASVGARTDPTGRCKPNVEVLFTDQPEAVVNALAVKTRGAILGAHYVHETAGLLDVSHPIQSWYVTATRWDDNTIEPAMSSDMSGVTKSTADKTPVIDSMYFRVPDRVRLGSRIPGRRISSIANVLIVADIRKVGGSEIGPVSDYIAMLALSEPRSLDACNELPSIFDLMSSHCGSRPKPDRLTESDVAYLKGLYAADLGATTNAMQKVSIQNAMEGRLEDRADRNAKPAQNSN